MTDSPGAIYGLMIEVQRQIQAVAKTQRNQHHGYNFRGVDDLLKALHPIFNHVGIGCTPEVVESEFVQFEVTGRNGTRTAYRSSVTMAYHFFAADGSTLAASAKGGSIDYDDKAEQQAQSQAYKTCMIQTFSIPTEGTEDPDSRSPMSEDAARARQSSRSPRGTEVANVSVDTQRKVSEAIMRAVEAGVDVDEDTIRGYAWQSEAHATKAVEELDGRIKQAAAPKSAPAAQKAPTQGSATNGSGKRQSDDAGAQEQAML